MIMGEASPPHPPVDRSLHDKVEYTDCSPSNSSDNIESNLSRSYLLNFL